MPDDCKECIEAVNKVAVTVGKIETTLEILKTVIVTQGMKMFFAMLAFATATIGSKFIGTPWYIEVTMVMTMFGAVFISGIVYKKWRCLSLWDKWARISCVLYCCWVTGLRIYHYQLDTPMTKEEGMISQLILGSMIFGWIALAWVSDANKHMRNRRESDNKDLMGD